MNPQLEESEPHVDPAGVDSDRRSAATQRMERIQFNLATASQVAVILLAVLASFATLYMAKAILFPISVALLLNLVFSPVVAAMKRNRIPNVVGAAAVLLFTVGLAGLIALIILPAAGTWIDQAREDLRKAQVKVRDSLQSVRQPLADIDAATEEVGEMTAVGDDIQPLRVQIERPSLSNTLLTQSGTVVGGALVTFVLLFFLLASGDQFLGKLVSIMPTWRDKRAMVDTAKNIQSGMSRYLITTSLINVGLGGAIAAAMYFAGLPNPLLWGFMAALLNFVPFVGAMVGASVVFFVGLVAFEPIQHALVAPALYIGINAIEANFVTPYLIGRSIQLNPVMILVSLAVWGWIWGVGGAVIAVPLLAVAKIFCDSFERLHAFGRILGE